MTQQNNITSTHFTHDSVASSLTHTILSDYTTGSIFICAGEPSGDLYASLYVQQMKTVLPGCDFIGIGGTRMKKVGVRLVITSEQFASLGLKTAISTLPRHLILLRRIKKAMQTYQPRVFIAVAYPGINLLLCEFASRIGCSVHYLLPPQAWAWGGFRVNLVARWVDTVISVFPFEYDFYRNRGVPIIYWAHPLLEFVQHYIRKDTNPRLGIMPGSRPSEIQRNLPVIVQYLSTAQSCMTTPKLSLIFHSADVLEKNPRITLFINTLQDTYPDRVEVYTDNHYQHMKNCDFLITCSGTASLEAAFMNIPQVFCNRCSRFDATFMRPFVVISEYNLANLYYGRKMVPVCVSSCDKTILSFLNNINIKKYFN